MDELEAIYDFIAEFSTVPKPNILRGYEKVNVLPKTANYCVFELDDLERRGSNIQTWADTETTYRRLLEFSVIIDFVNADRAAAAISARNLEIIARSLTGLAFFKERGLAVEYATQEYLPVVSDDNEYTHRFRVHLHLSKWEDVTVTEQTAKETRLNFVVNVDAGEKVTNTPPKLTINS